MKTIIALLFLRLFCMSGDYYMVNAVAHDCMGYTSYTCENGNVFTSYDHDNGSGVLVMDSKGTEATHDDEIIAFIGR